jgi:chromosome segregation protein
LHNAELEYNRLFALVSNKKSELMSSEKRFQEITREIEALNNQNSGLNKSDLGNKLTKTEKDLGRCEEDLAKYRGGLTQIISAERAFEQSNQTYEREKRLLQDEKSEILTKLSAIEVEVAKTQVRLEDLNEEMRLGQVGIDLDTKYGYIDQMEKDVLKLKMENLRRKLDTIGGVDPETEAEFTELEQREVAMSTQVDDLTKAKSDLEKIVGELDERIKKQFSHVFGNISKEFTRYFAMLFGGGNANLKLGEDEEGSFGIEISANPPGKRVQSLNALSGGERTLTSLALLFAILSVNPSPFCVLDEVDAALDESNTLRFVKILSDLAHKTQFIIISHNRDTMKIANSLYGVTMNDEHVSKLLSIHLTEALVGAKK